MTAFEYTTASGRPPGPFVSAASRVLSGVRTVQEQIPPFAAAWDEHNRRVLADATEAPVWVALGDSMTQGVGAPDIYQGWVGQLATRLAAEGTTYRVVNLASSGARVEDVLDRQLPALAQLESLGIHPELVTVLIGSNDLVRRRYREHLPARFGELIRRLPEGAVVANLPNPHQAATDIDAQIRRAVTQRGLRLADLRTPRTSGWKGKLAPDHFHPNALGYADLAETFHRAVRDTRQLPLH